MSVYGKLLQNNKNISESSSFLTASDITYPPYTLSSISIMSSVITSSNNIIDIKFTTQSSAIPEGYVEDNSFSRNKAFDYYKNPDNALQWCIKGISSSSTGGLALRIGFIGTSSNQNVTLRIEANYCDVYITYFDVVTTSVNNAPLNIVKLENARNSNWKTLNIYSNNFRTLRDHLDNFPIFINVDV